jgi:zinc protease
MKLISKLLAFIAINLIFFVSAALAIPPIQRLTLNNSASAYLIETKVLPIIDIEVIIDAGSRYDPPNKTGLAALTASLLNLGIQSGKKIISEAAIADEIADLGASLSVMASGERATMRIRSLSRADLRQRVVELGATILAHPRFEAKIVEREKQRLIAQLLDAETKPEYILERQFKKAVFRDYPLGSSATAQSIAQIQVSDLKQFHQLFYRSDRITVNLVGDIDRQEATQIAQALLLQLAATGPDIAPLPKLTESPVESASARVTQIAFDAQQTHIAMGMTAIPRNDPDYFPLLVGNYVLGGGGFVSRLMNEVREKRGLAYSVSSYFIPGKNVGIFQAGLQTRNDQAGLALGVMRETIARFINEGPSAADLVAAKANLSNGYPLRIDSNRKLLDNLSSITWNNLPLDTLETWTKQIEAITVEQVRQAFQKHLAMNRMQTVVVGASITAPK